MAILFRVFPINRELMYVSPPIVNRKKYSYILLCLSLLVLKSEGILQTKSLRKTV